MFAKMLSGTVLLDRVFKAVDGLLDTLEGGIARCRAEVIQNRERIDKLEDLNEGLLKHVAKAEKLVLGIRKITGVN